MRDFYCDQSSQSRIPSLPDRSRDTLASHFQEQIVLDSLRWAGLRGTWSLGIIGGRSEMAKPSGFDVIDVLGKLLRVIVPVEALRCLATNFTIDKEQLSEQ